MADLTGQTVGRYHIVEQLGMGGMAVVYKAFDLRLERDVAIKFIRTERIPPDELERMLARFEREGKALARLEHTHIIRIFDYGEHEGAPYLVMNYLPGGTLKQYTQHPMNYKDAVRLLLPIARALDYAHQQGVVHRDVKPANILISRQGEPMLSDFGIARILESEGTTLTGTGVGIGTPEYMAPEQWNGQFGLSVDIYAFGVVLYELITGHVPFQADTPIAILVKVMKDPLPRPSSYVPGLPDEVEKVLFKALAREVEDRYASMGEMIKAMDRLLLLDENLTPVVMPSGAPVARKPQPPEADLFQTEVVESIPPLSMRPTLPAVEEMTAPEPPTLPAPAVEPKVQPGWTVKRISEPVKSASERTSMEWNPEEPIQETSGAGLPGRTLWLWLAGGSCFLCVILFLMGLAGSGLLAQLFSPPTVVLTVVVEKTRVQVVEQTKIVVENVAVPEPTATIRPTSTPGPLVQRYAEIDGMQQVFVPPGNFDMGSENGDPAEKPVHTVSLDGFWIDQYEVTNAQYALCVAAGVCTEPYSNRSVNRDFYYGNEDYAAYPVIYVSWDNASTYCAWAGRHLPTEAQWEKAARGTDERKYPWGNTEGTCSQANYGGCMDDTRPAISGMDGSSPYHAVNMAGNVWEWVEDWFNADYYASSPSRNPGGPDSGDLKVIRGGSWLDGTINIRSSARGTSYAGNGNYLTGFRCASSE